MQDRHGTNDLANGAVRYGVYDADGSLLRYEWIRPEDEPLEAGTPLLKANLLTDATAEKVWPAGDAPADPKIDEALAKLTTPRARPGDVVTTARYLDETWYVCDGSTFSQTDYPALYAALGSTTLPDISYSSDTTTYIKMVDD